jgi:hypothetical protein
MRKTVTSLNKATKLFYGHALRAVAPSPQLGQTSGHALVGYKYRLCLKILSLILEKSRFGKSTTICLLCRPLFCSPKP